MQTRIIVFIIVCFFITITPPVLADIRDPLANDVPTSPPKIEDYELEQEFKWLAEEALVTTPTRHHKPVFQVPENITVITSEEIKQMNYHTLSDVLYHVTGVTTEIFGAAPGHGAFVRIQGSQLEHVTVLIDGVTTNSLPDNFTDTHYIPAQIIERIEIIKGPASSTWGSSLGGIINVITKSASGDKKISGTLQTSFGESNTGDYRAEADGTIGRMGYYLYGGRLKTNGLPSTKPNDQSTFYTKLKFDLTDHLKFNSALGYYYSVLGLNPALALKLDFNRLYSSSSINYMINEEIDLDLSFSALLAERDFDSRITTSGPLNRKEVEKRYKSTSQITWQTDKQTLVMGGEFENLNLSSEIIKTEQDSDEWAFFINDTLLFDKFTLTPGIRYDRVDRGGNFFSPSIGATYLIHKEILLRMSIAKGFNVPPFTAAFGDDNTLLRNPDIDVEQITSYQIGIETGILKYLRLKTSFFRHDINDAISLQAISSSENQFKNTDKVRNQGVELEFKTVPFHNTTFTTGFSYIDSRDRKTDEKFLFYPEYTYDLGVAYNDRKSLSISLKGNYTWWHPNPLDNRNGKYNSFITDASITKKIRIKPAKTADLFFTAHNIFDGSQYLTGSRKNVSRWVEAGFRFEF
tara:strand:+ start:885 stop:2786 length:1902 start_codon:yes stop_codon:yes gene_type:complete